MTSKHWRWVMDLPNFADIHDEHEFYDLVLNGEPQRLRVRRIAAWPERPRHIAGSFLKGAGRLWRSGYPTRRLEN
jgi:hypothetical protein